MFSNYFFFQNCRKAIGERRRGTRSGKIGQEASGGRREGSFRKKRGERRKETGKESRREMREEMREGIREEIRGRIIPFHPLRMP
ncbi:MAG: hypothetical protein ABIK97_03945 [candidate division WOR-3 bacterium]